MRFDIHRRADGTVEILDLRSGQGETIHVPFDVQIPRKAFETRDLALPSHKICLTQA